MAACRTCRQHKSLPSSSTVWPWKMGPTGCPKTSVTNYQSTLCNIPEERRSQIMPNTTEKEIKNVRKTFGPWAPYRAPGPRQLLPAFHLLSSALSATSVLMHILNVRSTRTCLLFRSFELKCSCMIAFSINCSKANSWAIPVLCVTMK